MDKVLLSIVCNTYNHEKYIYDALEGFLKQKVDFKYEIIIHDDASTDQTVQIIKKYEKKYPDIIHPIYQMENQYSKKKKSIFLNYIYPICKGKYIAICEGDDFWIDAHKLQLQIDFLEAHSDYALTAHNAICLNHQDFTLKAMSPYNCDKEVSAEEIIMQYNGNIPTASMVFRRDAIQNEDLFFECCIGDMPIQLCSIIKGKIYYFDRIMSVYRFCHEGSWTISWMKDVNETFEHCIAMIEFFLKYNEYSKFLYDKYIITRTQRYVENIINILDKATFFEILNKYNMKTKYKYNIYLNELKRVFMQTYYKNYYDKELENFINKSKRILVFGAGDYAQRIEKQLRNNNVEFNGFVVSALEKEVNEYKGKPVWTFGNMPFKPNEVGIIVAIKPLIWNQLLDILQENNITRFICPFLFHDILKEV